MGKGGTVRFYGCPGEEGASGKTFMVREGVFDDVDAALTWHPEAFAGAFTPARWQTFRHHGASRSQHMPRILWDAAPLMP